LSQLARALSIDPALEHVQLIVSEYQIGTLSGGDLSVVLGHAQELGRQLAMSMLEPASRPSSSTQA